ncbi:response regulator transcription factor [Methylibium rhizosphaerae]|uniref:response regulator transcription factor n=1 Tax=Methylibium rhizosphaerae TaxID=2570323 RepID=UPI0011266B4A|nr:response regulator transcription factor [Methylibium rhizosphaerae]
MKVLLIDDHALFRDALALLITQKLPGLSLLQAGSMAEALQALQADPDVTLALLDLGLPDSQGLDSLARMHDAAPLVTVVVLSADERRETIIAAIEAGAAGFIPKTAQGSVLDNALRVVLDGGVYVPREALDAPGGQRFAGLLPAATTPLDLSPRQLDVLRLLIEGKSNKLICRELDLSESTVKTHLGAIFRRLDVNSRTQAVLAAARLGLRLQPRSTA